MRGHWTVVRLKGGLGNQLFQFAFGLTRTHKNGGRLALDTSWFRSQDLRHEELTSIFRGIPVSDLRSKRDGEAMALRGGDDGPSGSIPLVAEQSLRFDARMLEPADGSRYFDGYFQSWRYVEGARSAIELALTHAPDSPWLADFTAAHDLGASIAVHVRLGDYRTNPSANRVHGVLTPDYFARAIEVAKEQSGLSTLLLVSDEPALARELVPALRDAEVVEPAPGTHDMETIKLLARCGARVTANSSFSWWGARLAGDSGGPNVVPWPWFQSTDLDPADLVPSDWIRVPASWNVPIA